MIATTKRKAFQFTAKPFHDCLRNHFTTAKPSIHFLKRSTVSIVKRAASLISSSVFVEPKLKRTLSLASRSVKPIAVKTWLGFTDALAQAEPAARHTPFKSILYKNAVFSTPLKRRLRMDGNAFSLSPFLSTPSSEDARNVHRAAAKPTFLLSAADEPFYLHAVFDI